MTDRFIDSFTKWTLSEMLVPHGSRVMVKLNRLKATSWEENHSTSTSLWGAATTWGKRKLSNDASCHLLEPLPNAFREHVSTVLVIYWIIYILHHWSKWLCQAISSTNLKDISSSELILSLKPWWTLCTECTVKKEMMCYKHKNWILEIFIVC